MLDKYYCMCVLYLKYCEKTAIDILYLNIYNIFSLYNKYIIHF